MSSTPLIGAPGPASASLEYRLKRDSYVWLAGRGYRPLRRGTLLSGELIRRNEVFNKLVLATDEGVLNVNEEDVELIVTPGAPR